MQLDFFPIYVHPFFVAHKALAESPTAAEEQSCDAVERANVEAGCDVYYLQNLSAKFGFFGFSSQKDSTRRYCVKRSFPSFHGTFQKSSPLLFLLRNVLQFDVHSHKNRGKKRHKSRSRGARHFSVRQNQFVSICQK